MDRPPPSAADGAPRPGGRARRNDGLAVAHAWQVRHGHLRPGRQARDGFNQTVLLLTRTDGELPRRSSVGQHHTGLLACGGRCFRNWRTLSPGRHQAHPEGHAPRQPTPAVVRPGPKGTAGRGRVRAVPVQRCLCIDKAGLCPGKIGASGPGRPTGEGASGRAARPSISGGRAVAIRPSWGHAPAPCRRPAAPRAPGFDGQRQPPWFDGRCPWPGISLDCARGPSLMGWTRKRLTDVL